MDQPFSTNPIDFGKRARENYERNRRNTAIDPSRKHQEGIRETLTNINWRIVLIGVVILILAGAGIGLYFLLKQAPLVSHPAPSVHWTLNPGGLLGENTYRFTIRSVPQNIGDLVSNWLGWIILIPLVWLLVGNFKSETTDRNEPKDYQAVMRGLLVCLIMYFLADAIALKTLQICQFFEQGCNANGLQYWTTIILRAMGAAFLIGSGFAAAAGGNWDASPISVSLFLVGILTKLTWPGARFLGDIALIIAILVHIYEIARHQDARVSALSASLLTIVASLVVGTLVAYGANSISLLAPYRFVIGFAAMVMVALGTSSTVQHKVGAILPGAFRENLKDVPGNIYFDMKIIVLMAAITYLIIG